MAFEMFADFDIADDEVDSTSIISSATTGVSSPIKMSEHERIMRQEDDALFARLGKGMAIMDVRSKKERIELDPVTTISQLNQKEQTTRSTFDRHTTQVEWLKHHAEQKDVLYNTISQVSDLKVELNIPLEMVEKQHQVTIHTEDHQFDVRGYRVKSHFTTFCHSALSVLRESWIDRLSSSNELTSHPLNIDTFMTVVREKIRRSRPWKQSFLTKWNVAQKECYFMSTEVAFLQDFVPHREEKLTNDRDFSTVIEDQFTDGSFIRIGHSTSDWMKRAKTMLPEDAIGTSDKALFNLSFKQMRQLTTWIFSRNPTSRMRVKIELLSSLRDSIRNEIMLNPLDSLIQSFREHALTRLDILHFFFYEDERKNYPTCIACEGKVNFTSNNSATHAGCDIDTALVKLFQFEVDGHNIIAPPYLYLKPSTTVYAKELLKLRLRETSKPFVGQSTSRLLIGTLDASGKPSTSQLGTREVTGTVGLDRSTISSLRPSR